MRMAPGFQIDGRFLLCKRLRRLHSPRAFWSVALQTPQYASDCSGGSGRPPACSPGFLRWGGPFCPFATNPRRGSEFPYTVASRRLISRGQRVRFRKRAGRARNSNQGGGCARRELNWQLKPQSCSPTGTRGAAPTSTNLLDCAIH